MLIKSFVCPPDSRPFPNVNTVDGCGFALAPAGQKIKDENVEFRRIRVYTWRGRACGRKIGWRQTSLRRLPIPAGSRWPFPAGGGKRVRQKRTEIPGRCKAKCWNTCSLYNIETTHNFRLLGADVRDAISYQIEDERSEKSGAVAGDVNNARPLAAQLGRDQLHRVLDARVHGDCDKEAAGHGQDRHRHCPVLIMRDINIHRRRPYTTAIYCAERVRWRCRPVRRSPKPT